MKLYTDTIFDIDSKDWELLYWAFYWASEYLLEYHLGAYDKDKTFETMYEYYRELIKIIKEHDLYKEVEET